MTQSYTRRTLTRIAPASSTSAHSLFPRCSLLAWRVGLSVAGRRGLRLPEQSGRPELAVKDLEQPFLIQQVQQRDFQPHSKRLVLRRRKQRAKKLGPQVLLPRNKPQPYLLLAVV